MQYTSVYILNVYKSPRAVQDELWLLKVQPVHARAVGGLPCSSNMHCEVAFASGVDEFRHASGWLIGRHGNLLMAPEPAGKNTDCRSTG